MFKLDDNFLHSIGLGQLPVDEKNKMLSHIYDRLEMNVGMRLAEQMTDEQLDEFEGFIDTDNESGALQWLEANFPNYRQVVADELEKLKREVAQLAPQIMAASQQMPAQAPAQPQGPPPQYNMPQQMTNQPQVPPQPVQPQYAAPSHPQQHVPFQPTQSPYEQQHPYAQPQYPQGSVPGQPMGQPMQPQAPPYDQPQQGYQQPMPGPANSNDPMAPPAYQPPPSQ